jgi:hypothetical protein
MRSARHGIIRFTRVRGIMSQRASIDLLGDTYRYRFLLKAVVPDPHIAVPMCPGTLAKADICGHLCR